MKSINLKEVIKTKLLDSQDGMQQDTLRENIKLKIVEVQPWIETTPHNNTRRGSSRKVKVQNTTQGAEVFSNVNTKKESVLHKRIKLTSGILHGYNGTVNLPLPENLHKYLGEKISFNPGKEYTVDDSDTMTIGTTSGHDLPAAASATATITTTEMEYHGKFRCTVALKGTVQVKSSGSIWQHDIGQMVHDFYPEVIYGNGKAQWEMEGEVEFKWDSDQKIVWQ